MKKIKISSDNRDKVEAALSLVNGRSTSFTITSYEAVCMVVDRCSKMLCLPKKAWIGIDMVYVPAGPSAKAYKYAAKSTQLTLKRGSTDWFLEHVAEAQVFPCSKERFSIHIDPRQAEAIMAKAMEQFTIKEDAA